MSRAIQILTYIKQNNKTDTAEVIDKEEVLDTFRQMKLDMESLDDEIRILENR